MNCDTTTVPESTFIKNKNKLTISIFKVICKRASIFPASVLTFQKQVFVLPSN